MLMTRKLVLSAFLLIVIIGLIFYYRVNRSSSEQLATTTTETAVQQEVVSSSETQQETVEQVEVNTSVATRHFPAQETESEPTLTGSTGSAENSSRPVERSGQSTRNSTQPEENPTSVLSERVFNVIDEAQWLQQSGQWEESLVGLNALYSDFESMNAFEQSTLLNFYTNTLIRLEMWQESISAFTLMLTIPDLRPDINARALMALAQLHERVDESDLAMDYYEEWLEYTRDMPGMEQQTARVEQQLNGLR